MSESKPLLSTVEESLVDGVKYACTMISSMDRDDPELRALSNHLMGVNTSDEGRAYMTRLDAAEALNSELLEALRTMVSVSKEAHTHWDEDRDAKVGKYLAAMGGHLKGYRADLTKVHDLLTRIDKESHGSEEEHRLEKVQEGG